MKHYYRGILFFAFMTSAVLMSAQPAIEWGERYNAPAEVADEATDLAVDAAGNVYITGSGFNTGGNIDIITVKYDANGNQVWVRNYDRGIGGNDQGNAIALDAAGNVYVCGFSMSAGNSGDACVVKYDNAGTQQWASFYNGQYNQMDEAKEIAVSGAGDVFICGYSSDSLYLFDALTVCYNTAGTQQWAQLYDGPVNGNDELLDIVIDASSNVYVTGNREQAVVDWEVLTIKYNSAGAQQWLMTYAGTGGSDYGKAITLDNNGNVLVGAQSFMTNNWFDYVTIKYSNAGSQQWAARYNHGNNRFEDVWDIITDNAGCVYVTGQSQATGNNSTPPDATTVKYSPSGGQIWVQRYDGGFSEDDRAYAIALDDTANVYVAGYSKNASNSDYITIKYDSAGTQEYALRYNSQYNQGEQINALAVQNGNIYVTGWSSNPTNNDYFTLKYSYAAVGVQESSVLTSPLTAFPIPASDILNVNTGVAAGANSTLAILDITGRTVMVNTLTAGAVTHQVNVAELAQGTYTLAYRDADGNLLASRLFVKN